ncbi:MAG: hypothetical protein ACR2FY_09960 [Pirellulaceae bacterium]
MSKDRPPLFSNKPHSVVFGPIPADTLARIQECLFQGQKIQAIKIYREFTDAGLAVSKAAVEQLERELRAASPEKFTAAVPAKGGCLIVMVAICIIVAAVIGWIVSR